VWDAQDDAQAVPDGFALIEVLTARHVFIVRKWVEAASPKIKAVMREGKPKKVPAVAPSVPAVPPIVANDGFKDSDDP
jgi:hypothetical protein